MIEQFYDLRPEVLALDRKALSLCREQFAHVEEIRDYNQLKMLRAFTDMFSQLFIFVSVTLPPKR